MVDLSTLRDEMAAWWHDLHRLPEFGVEEQSTAALVAANLCEFAPDEVIEAVPGPASLAR
jgi:metal-dependent amidase/aminoacylase/carboxypeptidase family protein